MWSPEEMGEYDAMYESDGCLHPDIAWHGSRAECQECGIPVSVSGSNLDQHMHMNLTEQVANALQSASYDDYDPHSTDNEPEITHRYMIVLVGMTGFLDKADIVIRARSQEHAESLAAGIASACGGATIDSVYELV